MNKAAPAILLGLFSAAVAGAVSANAMSIPANAPQTSVQYPTGALNSDAGARALY
jgi:hypothetical protein